MEKKKLKHFSLKYFRITKKIYNIIIFYFILRVSLHRSSQQQENKKHITTRKNEKKRKMSSKIKNI